MKNPLYKFDNSFIKLLLRIIFTLLSILCIFTFLFNINTFLSLDTVNIVFIITFLLSVFYLYGIIITKKYRFSMIAMASCCSYRKLSKLVQNEVFTLEDKIILGKGNIYSSKNWLIIDGTFIPKKFILYFYPISNEINRTKINLYCSNGSIITIKAPYKTTHIPIWAGLKKHMPNAKLIHSIDDIDNSTWHKTLENILSKYNLSLEEYISTTKSYKNNSIPNIF